MRLTPSDYILFAAAHGFPILFTRLITNSRAKLAIVAFVMAGIAFAGAKQYTPLDLFVVGLTWFFCNNSINNSNTPKRIASASERNANSDSLVGVFFLVGIFAFFYFKSTDKPAPSPASQPSQQVIKGNVGGGPGQLK